MGLMKISVYEVAKERNGVLLNQTEHKGVTSNFAHKSS